TAAYADEFTGDRSVESLADFEAFLLDRLPSSVAAAHRSARDLVTRAMAYLGETLMWVGGGQWAWGAGELAGMPCVAFDAALGRGFRRAVAALARGARPGAYRLTGRGRQSTAPRLCACCGLVSR